MRPLFFPLISVVALLISEPAGLPLRAAETVVTIESLSLGIGGQFKVGYWTPVRIVLRGSNQPFRGRLEVVVPDADGIPTRYSWPDHPRIELGTNESLPVNRLIKLGRWRGTVVVELHGDGELVARREFPTSTFPQPISPEKDWIVGYGADLGIADALGRRSRTGSNTVVSQLAAVEQLPNHWLGWEAVDTLVLTTGDRTAIDAASTSQWNAMATWVSMGGRLIWSAGRHGKDLLGESGRFAELVPGKFQQVGLLRSLSTLESYSGSPQQIDSAADLRAGIPLTILAETSGVVELSEAAPDGPRPVIVRAPHGFGQAVFVAFDLDQPEIAKWDGRARILARILQSPAHHAEHRSGERSNTQVEQFGYQDMVGQLRSGLEQYRGVTLVALWWVAGLVVVYLVLIGPIDYLFLRDFLRRMTVTWLTFPLVTVIGVGLVFWLTPRWKGTELVLNQADLIDIDVVSGRLRGTTWDHLYSPRARKFELRTAPNAYLAAAMTQEGNVLAWQGLPGTGLGGLNTSAAAPPAIDEYRIEWANGPLSGAGFTQTTIEGLPIHVAATKSLVGRWWGEVQWPEIQPLTVDSDGLPQGEIVNPLPVKLSDCRVHFGSWAFRLDATRGILVPGQKTHLGSERPLNLQWRLTGRRVIDSKDFSTPWDQQTLAVPKILEMMMFHSAAGGETYTQLVNRYQSYVDLSEHLASGRAILIGRAEQPATSLIDGQQPLTADQHWTYFRIVFPVKAEPPRS